MNLETAYRLQNWLEDYICKAELVLEQEENNNKGQIEEEAAQSIEKPDNENSE